MNDASFFILFALSTVIVLGLFYLFYNRPSAGPISILLTFVFDSDGLSVEIMGGRVRLFQIMLLISFFTFFIREVVVKKRLKIYPLVIPTIAYLLANVLACINSPEKSDAIKILILNMINFSIVAIFWYEIRDTVSFIRAIWILVIIGIGLMFYGISSALFQNPDVAFVRTTGTFNDPDLMGILAAAFLIFSIGAELYDVMINKTYTRVLMISSLIVLMVVSVRTTVAGLLTGITIMIYRYIKRKGIRFGLIKSLMFISGVLFVVTIVMISGLSDVYSFLLFRITNIYDQHGIVADSRWGMMGWAIKLFLEHPVIGNGPGSFAVLGIIPGYEMGILPSRPYNPSILTTILSDTGVVGLITFLWLAARYWNYTRKSFSRRYDDKWFGITTTLFSCVVSLMVMYLFTTMFWVGATWVFIGMSVSATRICLYREQNVKHAIFY